MSAQTKAPRPPSVKVAKRRGRYVVDVSVTEAGERRRYRQKFERKAEAEAHANAIRARLARSLSPFETAEEALPSFTHADALEFYEESEHFKTCVPRSQKRTVEHRKTIVQFGLAKIEAEKATRDDLFGYRKARAEKAGRSVAPTVSKDLAQLRAALKHAKRQGRIASHVFERLQPEDARALMPTWKPENTAGRVIPPDELERILSKLNPRANRMARFLAATGVREMEAAALDWAVHFKDMPYQHFSPITQKRSKPRTIPFGNVAGVVGVRQSAGLVFRELGETAEEICKRFIAAWRYATKMAGSNARPHDLRHTWGSAARRSHSLEDVASVMGISAATARTYLDHEKADLARRVFGVEPGTNAALLPAEVKR